MTKRPSWWRPTQEEIDKSKWSNRTKRHYSESVMKKIEIGQRSVQSGQDPRSVCIRLFGSENEDLINRLQNTDQIK